MLATGRDVAGIKILSDEVSAASVAESMASIDMLWRLVARGGHAQNVRDDLEADYRDGELGFRIGSEPSTSIHLSPCSDWG